MSRSWGGSRAVPASASPGGVKRNPKRVRRDRDGVPRRRIGWDYVHAAVDDATRLAYAEVLSDEKATTAIAFLGRAIVFFERHGMTVRELLTDNGSPYRSAVHAIACRTLGIRHLRTRPHRPADQRQGLCLSFGGAVRQGGEAPRARWSDSGKRRVEREI
jgi:transposase InsO family protein